MIDISPDPAHPRGGYAVLSFDGAGLSEDSIAIEVFDLYKELYLGVAGWQPEKHAFGPYPVDRSSGQARVTVGPEIVDKLEEFATLRLTIGPVSADVSWPDDIVHSPNAATSQSAINTGSGPSVAAPAAPIRMKDPQPDPKPPEQDPADTLSPEDPTEPSDTLEDDAEGDTWEDEEEKSKLPLILGGLAVLAALAAVAFYLTAGDEPVVAEDPPPPPPVAAPPVAAAPDPCSDAELAATAGQGFAALGAALRSCGGAVGPDTALGLVEEAVASGDAEALAFFGTLYDAGQTDPVIEEQIGLTLGDNPARAAEYYARARDAGSAEAEGLLTGVCRTLLLRTDTLSISAREDYCPN